ncbi:MAG TPA: PQQ-binding-like beta-propeller repeat protein [Streptosporangiaceae bacterium]|jgi:outer membrane protein assembly factor BamB
MHLIRIRGRAWRRVARIPVVLSTVAFCAISAVAAGSASAAVASGSPAAPNAGKSADDWASFHHTANLEGVAANSSITTSTAANLGVKWAADVYGGVVDSPMVAYNATLKERVAYVGTVTGDLVAVNMANGQIVWGVDLGSELRGSPLVVNGYVWVATFDSPKIFKVNAATGAISCTVASARQIQGTPVAATPPGGVPSVYFPAGDTETAPGPITAIQQNNCSVEWQFTDYRTLSGVWTPLDYSVDATGEPLILAGTADTDSTIYAIDAVTGKRVWDYAAENPPPHSYDIGAGVVTTAPGVNGFADGMAYVESKYGVMYGLDLTTGAMVWNVPYADEIGAKGRYISTAAQSGQNLVLGDNYGMVDLNATNGDVIWHTDDPSKTGVDSSPAIVGPSGSQALAFGDLGGGFEVDSLATGAMLYHYQTAGYVTASPAVSGGNIVIASSGGFLYDFAAGGGNEATSPTAAVTSPKDSSQVANPNGNMTVTGTAADTAGVAHVVVAVQETSPNGQWWDAATGTWVSGPMSNPATVASPGGTSSNWTFSYPVPTSGGTYTATAYTVSAKGESSTPAESQFTVLPSTSSPQVKVGSRFVPPGGNTTVSGSGFGDSETVAITLGSTKIGTATTSSSGALPSTKVTVPTGAAFGLTSLTASGQGTADTATVGVSVANKWAAAGYDASHNGYEPYDEDIFHSIAAGGGTYMNLSWAYAIGASSAVSASPAVADTVAYVPGSTGKLTAVDVHSGAPLWTWQLASKAALGAPAVDPASGLVFVGGSDGSLTAISSYTGKKVWSDTVGGHPTAPVFGGGRLYVGSSTGIVEAVNETTGKKVWSTKLANPVTTSPALDTTAKLVIVGGSKGGLTALTTAGAKKWTHSVTSAVATPPAISGGSVYFGAGDSVHAVSEASGAIQWSYATPGAVSATLTVTSTSTQGKLVTVGSANGIVYGVKAANGQMLWKTASLGKPITGVASSYATYIVDTSTGLLAGGRITSGERLWERTTTAGAFTSPVIVDGTVYAGGHDGDLYAFTTDGQAPS